MNQPSATTKDIGETLSQDSTSKEIIDHCRSLAQRFKTRADHHDRTREFPTQNFAEIRSSGLLALMVPKEYGGLGSDFLTYTKAIEQLSMGDASTALAFNMHNIAAGTLAEARTEALTGKRAEVLNNFKIWAFNEIVQNKKLFASANSEPITGFKSWVSMAGHADYYVTAARKEGVESMFPDLSFFVIEAENPGIRIDEVWDTLGMRSTCTNMMHLEQVFVPDERLFLGTQGLGMLKLVREPHWTIAGYVGVYLGICSASFEFLCDYLQNRNKPGTEDPVANSDWIQHRVGELSVAMEACRTVVYDAARQVDEAPGALETNAAVHRSKYLAGELGPHLSSQAMRLCGGSTIAKRLPLERFYRDSRCGGLMPATSDECLLFLGKEALGFDMSRIDESYW